MSTFLGLVEEIPGICIDYFDKETLNSSIFFLSHCHCDHMKGLTNRFFNYLVKTNKFLYCSSISKIFLISMFNLNIKLNEYIKVLPIDDSVIINYVYNNIYQSIKVSSISSGHCLGSVMFLYTYENKKILYTGDYRINIKDFSKLKLLHYAHDLHSIPLHVDKIYLDTTFLNLNYKVFPSRTESLRELCANIKNWIKKDLKNIILLEISALFGSEFIYIELSKILHKKIHVQTKIYKVYKQIDILNRCVTDIGESTPIHACMDKTNNIQKSSGLKCRSGIEQKHILTIILSAQKWIYKDTSHIVEWDTIRKQTINICYSTHASYNELQAFLEYFKPKQVFACVCNNTNLKEIYDLLKKIQQKIKFNQVGNKKSKLDIFKCKFLNVNDCKPDIISDNEDDLQKNI